MKKIIKMLGMAMFLILLMNFGTKETQAAEVEAQITVYYIVFDNTGNSDTISYENYEGITNTLILPDGTEAVMETDTSKKDSAIGYFLAEGNDVSKLQTGTYTLKDIQYPAGYELDTDALEELSNYTLSITITSDDVEGYLSYLDWLEELGSKKNKKEYYDFGICIPVKKIGGPSLLMQTPPKAEISLISDTTLSVTEDYTAQFWYAAKKNGKYRLLEKSSSCSFVDHDELKDGKTYYFRARYVKFIRNENVYGEYSDSLKVKVRKSSVYKCTPKLKVEKKDGKTVLIVQGNKYEHDVMLYYSRKKNGTYKFSRDSFSNRVVLSGSKEWKKGKTYYFKVRFCDRGSSQYQVFYGRFSKSVKAVIE